jgi:hypothetical protein
MKSRVVALVLALGLLVPLSTQSAAASALDPPDRFDAIVNASGADLPALLASGQASEYAIISAAELGLDEAALAGLAGLEADALLPATGTGADVDALLSPAPVVVPAVAVAPGRFPVVVPAVTLRPVFRPALVGPAFTPFGRVLVIRRF